ncbi:exosome complex exonuclease RRP44-like [Petromyzon marinus]|uniref:exosome complex exonuclease RRP44-like n=1 Tax=Petromyzon marinus TaxID=7757 RepID=UPI003F6E4586
MLEEYVRSLVDNPELIDRLALASEQDVVESRVIFPEHLPLSQLQQGVRSGRFVQGTFLASRENYLEATLRVRGDGDSDKELKAESGKMRRPTGKVVGIIKRNSRPLCGMLMPSPIKEATRHLFTPADRRMPRVRVETRQAASLRAHRIVVAIDGWLRHSRYPNVRLHRDAPHAHRRAHPSVT